MIAHDFEGDYLYTYNSGSRGGKNPHGFIKFIFRQKNVLHMGAICIKMPEWSVLSLNNSEHKNLSSYYFMFGSHYTPFYSSLAKHRHLQMLKYIYFLHQIIIVVQLNLSHPRFDRVFMDEIFTE